MNEITSIQSILYTLSYSFIPVLLGIIIHEVAHGYVAYKKGDATAALLGRLTLNPTPHIDPLGFAMFVFTAIFSPFVFGWAKPIPVNMRNLRNPKKDMIWIAAAGPLSNIALAVIFTLLLKLLLTFGTVLIEFPNAIQFLGKMFQVGIFANLGLAFINLMPIPPLDGSKIVYGVLPYEAARSYWTLERYGMIILVILLATGILSFVLRPLILGSFTILAQLFSL